MVLEVPNMNIPETLIIAVMTSIAVVVTAGSGPDLDQYRGHPLTRLRCDMKRRISDTFDKLVALMAAGGLAFIGAAVTQEIALQVWFPITLLVSAIMGTGVLGSAFFTFCLMLAYRTHYDFSTQSD